MPKLEVPPLNGEARVRMMSAMLSGIIIGTGLAFAAYEMGFLTTYHFTLATPVLGLLGGGFGLYREYNRHLRRNSAL